MKTIANQLLLPALASIVFSTGPAWSQGLLMIENPAYTLASPQRQKPHAKADEKLEIPESATLTAALFAANDMVPVSRFDREPWPADYRTRSGNNLAITNKRLQLAVNRGDWSVGLFYRQDRLFRGSRDSVDARFLDHRAQLSGQVRTFDLDYSLRGFAADGVRIGFSGGAIATGAGDDLRWGVSASLLRGLSMRQETAKGNLISSVGSATLTGNRTIFNSRLQAVTNPGSFNAFAPAQAQDVGAGWGYAFDLGMRWHLQDGVDFAVAVNDLFGKITWDRAPVIEQTINGTFSGNTFAAGASAIISGSNRYQSFTYQLKPKLQLEGAYRLTDHPGGNVSLLARVESVGGEWFPLIGLSYLGKSKWRIDLDYETRFGSFGINLRNPDYYLALRSQGLNLNSSRVISISAGVNLVF